MYNCLCNGKPNQARPRVSWDAQRRASRASCYLHLTFTKLLSIPSTPSAHLVLCCASRVPMPPRQGHLPSGVQARPPSSLISWNLVACCDPALSKTSAWWGAAGTALTLHAAPDPPSLGGMSLNSSWEVTKPLCWSAKLQSKGCKMCLGSLLYLYPAHCITNGIQIDALPLTRGVPGHLGVLSLFFSCHYIIFLSQLLKAWCLEAGFLGQIYLTSPRCWTSWPQTNTTFFFLWNRKDRCL